MKGTLLFVLTFITFSVFAQTGIGTTTPNPSAKLDVYSTNKGFLPPRVTLQSATDATTIASPAEGLLVYNLGSSGLQAGYYYWNNANWATIATATSAGNGVTASDMRKIYDSVGNATTINSTGATFTVTTSGKYQIDFSASATCGNCTLEVNFQVRDGSNNNQVIASDKQTSYSNNVHSEYNGKVEVNLLSGKTYNVLVFTTTNYGYIANNDYCRVYMKQVAGNLPVTGQTVDYVSVVNSSLQTVNTGDNIKFNTINSGNIPYNASTGNFTLTAGKTYRLTGSVSLDGSNAGSSEIDIAWKNAAGDVLGNRALILSTNFASTATGNGVTDIIYTPTVNTTIALNVVYATANAKTVGNYTYATVEQIGSSAIVNPWTLSGTNTYNTTGNVGIGTNAPTQALDITGAVNISNSPITTQINVSPSTNWFMSSLNPSLSTSGTYTKQALIFGKATSTNNAGTLLYTHSTGDGSGSNIIGLGLYGNDNKLVVNGNGYVGIGTLSPSYPLYINSSVSTTLSNYEYLNTSSYGHSSSYTLPVSEWASGVIVAGEFDAVSDKRIKTNVHAFLSGNSISIINKLRPVTYEYIDKVSKGSKTKNGFIAQEVESVMPNAVNKSSDFIPNIFKLVNNEDGFDAICKECKIGDELKIITSKGDKIVKITEIKNSTKEKLSHLKIDWNEAESKYFVYGIKVNDFRTIDFDQITSLSISAIQELLKKNEDQEARLQKVEKFISELQKSNKH